MFSETCCRFYSHGPIHNAPVFGSVTKSLTASSPPFLCLATFCGASFVFRNVSINNIFILFIKAIFNGKRKESWLCCQRTDQSQDLLQNNRARGSPQCSPISALIFTHKSIKKGSLINEYIIVTLGSKNNFHCLIKFSPIWLDWNVFVSRVWERRKQSSIKRQKGWFSCLPFCRIYQWLTHDKS